MKDLTQLSVDKLLRMWEKGVAFLEQKEHDYPGDNAKDGTPYNHQLYLGGIKRIEMIEDELRTRGKHELLGERAVKTFSKKDEDFDLTEEFLKL